MAKSSKVIKLRPSDLKGLQKLLNRSRQKIGQELQEIGEGGMRQNPRALPEQSQNRKRANQVCLVVGRGGQSKVAKRSPRMAETGIYKLCSIARGGSSRASAKESSRGKRGGPI